MSMIGEQKFNIRTYEVDFKNNLKVSTIFNYMQEAAAVHAGTLQFGYDDLIKKNQAWVLSRAILEIFDTAAFGDEILVKTWAKDIDKLFALRDFIIYKNLDKIIAKATTAWILIDTIRKRPLKVDGIIEHKADASIISPAIDKTPDKIEEPADKNEVDVKKAYYDDIDLNQHVNNVKYIEYAFDAFQKDFFETKTVKTLQINFLSEVKFGDEIKIFKSKLNNEQYYIEGKREKDKIFQVILQAD